MSDYAGYADPASGTAVPVASSDRFPAPQPAVPEPTVIEVAGLSKRYGSLLALEDVSFAVERGGSLALWGPNGAGKTTVMRCLLGLARSTGLVRVDGFDPARQGERARRHIGYVPQDLPLSPMTVTELTRYVARLKRAPLPAAATRIAQLGLEEHGDKSVNALSGGLKQRLALALALVGSPTVLLLDEPTANLDARGRAELLHLLRGLRDEGMTLLFSSHRPEDILALADRVLLLDGGRVASEKSPAAFMRGLGETSRMVLYLSNGYVNEALAALTDLRVRRTPDGKVLTVAVQPHQKAEVLERLARAGVVLDDFDVERLIWN
jgi:ABC-type multidrug transport system ATPase subunit